MVCTSAEENRSAFSSAGPAPARCRLEILKTDQRQQYWLDNVVAIDAGRNGVHYFDGNLGFPFPEGRPHDSPCEGRRKTAALSRWRANAMGQGLAGDVPTGRLATATGADLGG